MKEALSIHTTPEQAHINRDSGYELPGCWITTYKKLKGGASMNARGARPGVRTNYIESISFDPLDSL